MIKETLVFLSLSIGVAVTYFIAKYVAYLKKLRSEMIFKEFEVKNDKIRGEVDSVSLFDLVKRNNSARTTNKDNKS